jgi:hypothetical protein
MEYEQKKVRVVIQEVSEDVAKEETMTVSLSWYKHRSGFLAAF